MSQHDFQISRRVPGLEGTTTHPGKEEKQVYGGKKLLILGLLHWKWDIQVEIFYKYWAMGLVLREETSTREGSLEATGC